MSPREIEHRLRHEIEAELARVESVVCELRRLAPALVAECAADLRMAVAGYLHGLYTGCEAMLAKLARTFGDMPAGERWHQELLLRSTAPMEGVRPPILTPATADLLLDLLRFRHFFRVAYGVELVPAKLREHADRAPMAFEAFRGDLRAFLGRLEPLRDADEPG